ncbi:MAG: aspartate carbamoyltransferase, partial [Acutalibacteraceae bacterium]
MKKDVLGLRNVKKEEIEQILATAAEMKQKLQNDEKKLPYLAGKSVVTLFY